MFDQIDTSHPLVIIALGLVGTLIVHVLKNLVSFLKYRITLYQKKKEERKKSVISLAKIVFDSGEDWRINAQMNNYYFKATTYLIFSLIFLIMILFLSLEDWNIIIADYEK